jgi:hypothetical protein
MNMATALICGSTDECRNNDGVYGDDTIHLSVIFVWIRNGLCSEEK